MFLWLVLDFSVFILVLFELYQLLNTYSPFPIEDEKYHVPQAQRLFQGNAHWDPMISTPPGPYVVSNSLIYALRVNCELGYLRETSLVYACSIIFFIGRLGVVICLSPIVLPYTQLFYTDIGSVMFVLLANRLFEASWHLLAASICVLAVFFRQTNIIWVGYFALSMLFTRPDFSPYMLFGYATAMLLFLVFVIVNGGVAMGDRQHHQVGFNICQIFYLASSVFLLLLPILNIRSSMQSFEDYFRAHPILVNTILLVHILAVGLQPDEHPYQRSDGHLTATIWHYTVCLHPIQKYLWIPFYVFAEYTLLSRLPYSWDTMIKIFCLCLTVVPSRLVEPRYFIVPSSMYLVWLNLSEQEKTRLVLYYFLVDHALMIIFAWPLRHKRPPLIW